MIVLFRSTEEQGRIQPIVVVDYQRSDEQWTPVQIQTFINKARPKVGVLAPAIVYSLDHSISYTHSGIVYGDSLKTRVQMTIINAPIDLVTLLNIQQYTSQQNVDALKKVIKAVIDPQVAFPTGLIVIKTRQGQVITRPFLIFATQFNFDDRRITSNLVLRGASFDSMVVRLKFAVNLTTTTPLLLQLQTIFEKQGLFIKSNGEAGLAVPAIAKYYAPGPINSVLGEVCRDNNLAFDNVNNIITLHSLSPDDPPPADIVEELSFMNKIERTRLIVSFSLQNYTSCEFKAEVFDAKLFTSIAVYDDSPEVGLFANLTAIAEEVVFVGGAPIEPYRFYVQEYTLIDSRAETSILVRGTNNWLVSNFKLDTIFENKVYTNALQKG